MTTPIQQPLGRPFEDATRSARTAKKSSHPSNTLARALEKAHVAVQRDRAGNLRGALSSYRGARELLSKARRRMSNDEDARKLDTIADTYDARIRLLRQAINNEPREESEDSSPGEDASPSTRQSSLSVLSGPRGRDTPPDSPRTPRTPNTPPDTPDTPHTARPSYPPRRDSHQHWPLTPQFEIKATIERYMKRKLPERPDARTPRFTPRAPRRLHDFYADDETVEILQQFESGWWDDLIDGSSRWSLSSDRTLVAPPGAYLQESRKSRHRLSPPPPPARSGAESPTDSIRFWSPPATPVRTVFEGDTVGFGRQLRSSLRT